MRIIPLDICKTECKYILQQGNCITVNPKGLSLALEKAFPGSCPYRYREPIIPGGNICKERDRPKVGTIHVSYPESRGTDREEPVIITIFGQYSYGKPSDRSNFTFNKTYSNDAYFLRKTYFHSGLEEIKKILPKDEKVEIAVPYGIGCGLAGGVWEDYEKMLIEFENEVENVEIVLHKI